jgi:S1-C subfamily serine protease
VARQTDRLRRRLIGTIVVVGAMVAGAAGWFGWTTLQERRERSAIRDRLLREVDSLQAILLVAGEQASGLRLALDSAQQRTFALRQSVAGRDLDQSSLAVLDSQIAAAVTRNQPLVRAARFDAAAVTAANAPALAMVFAELDSARSVSATGFVARTRADTAWLVTSRHAVTGSLGQPPVRLGVAFNGSGEVYRARFLAADDSADVAVLRVVGRPSQAIAGIGAAAAAPGDPVALLGFPLGLDLQPGDWQQAGISASTTTATVSRLLPDALQLDGYGVAGASGSPVFTADGALVGVLSGGERDSGGRIVYAVPALRVMTLLDRVAPAPNPRQP